MLSLPNGLTSARAAASLSCTNTIGGTFLRVCWDIRRCLERDKAGVCRGGRRLPERRGSAKANTMPISWKQKKQDLLIVLFKGENIGHESSLANCTLQKG